MSGSDLREQLDRLLTMPVTVPDPISGGRFTIYGAGTKGREALGILRHRGCEVAAFIDRSASGRIDGIPILAADDPTVAEFAHAGCTAIVAVFNPGVDPLPIHEHLYKVGFWNVIGMVEARQPLAADDTYWLAPADVMTPSISDAVWLFDTLADDLSRVTLLEAISLRRSWKPADLWEIPLLIDDLLPDSDFYLRAHAWNGFDLVFYAVPHEMARA